LQRVPILARITIFPVARRGTPREATDHVKQLLDGLRRYERTTKQRYSQQFASLAAGQSPLALFVTCADSRVVPSLIASADPGELFVVRNIASLGPRSDADDPSVPAAVSYAVDVLGVRDVVVCGHSSCGGIQALMGEPLADSHLRRWLDHALPGVDSWRARGPLDASRSPNDQVSQSCTLAQLDNLMTYPGVRARVRREELRLHAWWFDIAEGSLLAYSREDGRYVAAVDEMTRREAVDAEPFARSA
jgi:carbonic anhydrase